MVISDPRHTSCAQVHESIVVITGRAHSFHDCKIKDNETYETFCLYKYGVVLQLLIVDIAAASYVASKFLFFCSLDFLFLLYNLT